MIPVLRLIDRILAGLPENSRLRAELSELKPEIQRLRAQVEALEAELRDAKAEIDRLRNPSEDEPRFSGWDKQ